MKKWLKRLVWLGLVGVLIVGYLWLKAPLVQNVRLSEGNRVKFRTNGIQIEEYTEKGWKPFFIKGINMGHTLPGHYAEDINIPKEEYIHWFGMIKKAGIDVIRIYTLHNPDFYEALVKYNKQHKEDPLYFIQGVWTPEDLLNEKLDAYLPNITEAFKHEIKVAVKGVYGDMTQENSFGKIERYKANAGQYLVAWQIGTEWAPEMVVKTNELHKGVRDFKGKHFQTTKGTSPFEKWLAENLDYAAELENGYGWQHPIAYTNWISTDPIPHPGEPIKYEDMVSVDPTHIKPIHWDAGYFASYHAYPYYPDFFRYDQSFQTVKNSKGEIDSYQGYLRKLKEFHKDMPVIISEFGVPSSIGIAHVGPLKRNQGGHDEKEQGEIDRELLQLIYHEGFSGAILFSWQDEWFKKTWNNKQFESGTNLWTNVLTNESYFGIQGMFPSKDNVLHIDGNGDEWDRIDDKKKLNIKAPGYKGIWVTHDEGYVYLKAQLTKSFDPNKQNIYLGFDTLPGGNRHGEQLKGKILDKGLEGLIQFENDKEGQVLLASNYDFHTRYFGLVRGMLEVDPKEMKNNSGIFNPVKMVVDYKLRILPENIIRPFSEVVVSDLKRGTSDYKNPNYHSHATWEAKGNTLEMRIPWALFGFSNPSKLEVMNYKIKGKMIATEEIPGIRFVPWIYDKTTNQVIGLKSKTAMFPVSHIKPYKWEPWNKVNFVERPKQSYEIMEKAYQEISKYNPR